MQTETKNAHSRTLAIDGMSGDGCVTKVKSALKAVPAITTESVSVGAAVIGADQRGCDAACTAISAAGYRATEKNGTTETQNRKPGSNVENKAADATATGHAGKETKPMAEVAAPGQHAAPKM